MEAPHEIRQIGDPVLRQKATPVLDIDGRLAALAADMIETMYAAPGVGLAAPQVGVRKRFFVYDVGDGPATIVNPEILASDGEWAYDEGCLSIPGLSWTIVRPKQVHLVGYDLHGDEISIEADEILARCFQHELRPPRRGARDRTPRCRDTPLGHAHHPRAAPAARRTRRVTVPPPAGPVHRVAFLGTPEAAVGPLRALVEAGFEVPVVVSRPDGRRGRGSAVSPSPVKAAAAEMGLPVTDDPVDATRVAAELGVVVAYGRILRADVLDELPLVNLHFSLLPRWRGAAPVERAILAGDTRTGVDLMSVQEGLDTGGIHARTVVDIDADESAQELRARLSAAGAAMLVSSLRAGLGEARPQQGEPTYAAKIDPAELALDWSWPAVRIHRVVRVGEAYTTHLGRRLKIWRTTLDPGPDSIVVDAGDRPVGLVVVQPEGRARMAAVDWARGSRWRPGDPLGT